MDSLPAAAGVDRAVDQVKRLEAFRETHPGWRIWCDRDSYIWHALRMTEGGRDEVERYSLRQLLDHLEKH
jgi:hypothetical protein